MGGIFTPTESGAVAVVAAIVASMIYRTFDFKQLPEILFKTGVSTSGIMLIVAFGNIMGWTLAMDNIPAKIINGILSVTTNANVVMLLIILSLLAIGWCNGSIFCNVYIYSGVCSSGDICRY